MNIFYKNLGMLIIGLFLILLCLMDLVLKIIFL